MQTLEAKALAAGFSKAKIVAASFLTPTVRQLKFEVIRGSNLLNYQHPGQWLDCVIPQAGNVVGGFSLTSSPLELPQLELAVKFSAHAPAKAAVTAAQLGDEWLVRAGGTFGDVLLLPEKRQALEQRLLVAAGIGITPLIAIIKHAFVLYQSKGIEFPETSLLYSAKSLEELAYNQDLVFIANSLPNGRFKYRPFITENNDCATEDAVCRRISSQDLETVIAEREKNVVCLLCGPKSFATDMDKSLTQLGLAKCQIHYEAWW